MSGGKISYAGNVGRMSGVSVLDPPPRALRLSLVTVVSLMDIPAFINNESF